MTGPQFTTSLKNPLRIVLLGFGPLALRVLKGLLACPETVTVVGVVAWSHVNDSEYDDAGDAAFLALARSKSLLLTDALKEPELEEWSANHPSFHHWLHQNDIDVVWVASWGQKLSAHTLALSTQAAGPVFLNTHPSLLPMHKGPNPYVAAIMACESESGVTFHHMDADYDTGPIVFQARVPLLVADTGGSLRDRIAEATETVIPKVLTALHANVAQPQQGEGSYESSIQLSDAAIRWESESSDAIVRRARAYMPWITPYCVGTRKPFGMSVLLVFKAITALPDHVGASSLPVQGGKLEAVAQPHVIIQAKEGAWLHCTLNCWYWGPWRLPRVLLPMFMPLVLPVGSLVWSGLPCNNGIISE
jgi:methionyl-tRNA formyltransferase